MWQAIKNVTTYGSAVMLVMGVAFVLLNLVCCGACVTTYTGLYAVGTAVENVSAQPETAPQQPVQE